ncbi:hypothetical protein [Rhizobium chutanense]|uniref:hypothetical protein n=1 Tax=Rhizobium chutanense TaxID=2035448 RepID=UPI0013E08759|nr:hypothetical protein [Rhizobium chutanense]
MMNAASDLEAAQQQTADNDHHQGRAIVHIEPFSRVLNRLCGKARRKLTKMQCAGISACANSPQLRVMEAKRRGWVAAAWLHGAYVPVMLRLSKMIPAELAIAAG